MPEAVGEGWKGNMSQAYSAPKIAQAPEKVYRRNPAALVDVRAAVVDAMGLVRWPKCQGCKNPKTTFVAIEDHPAALLGLVAGVFPPY